jgi:hypothetical protein
MTFSRKIVGLALGILVGLFFGGEALAPGAFTRFVKVPDDRPYVTVSIIESLGSLGTRTRGGWGCARAPSWSYLGVWA